MGTRSIRTPAAADAEAVRRLRAAGAIPVGITNVPELMIFPWTATAANGVTRNPWHLDRTPGGSSGGSASAVAAGMVAAATGSDGGGSIRIPAACCGLVGMKPTRGRVTAQPDGSGWLGLSVFGALARTVSDSALLLDVMHGALPGDEYAAPAFEGSYMEAASKPPERLRIAVSRKVPPGLIARVSQDQRVAWERTAKLLSELGHEVVERSPAYGLAQLDFLQMWLRGIYEATLDVPDAAQLEPLTRQMAAGGRWVVPPGRRARLTTRQAATSARIMALWDDDRRPAYAGHGDDRDRGRGRFRQAGAAGDRRRRPLHAVHAAVQLHRAAGDHGSSRNRGRRRAAERPAGGPPRRRGPALFARRTARVGRAMGAAAPAVGVRSLRR